MSSKFLFRKIIVIICSIVLVLFCIFQLINHTLPHEFNELLPDRESIESCHIFSISTDYQREADLTGVALSDFLTLLDQCKYYYEGSAESTIEGVIYHVYLYTNLEDNIELKITDTGKLYINSCRYDLKSNNISSYLETLLDQQ